MHIHHVDAQPLQPAQHTRGLCPFHAELFPLRHKPFGHDLGREIERGIQLSGCEVKYEGWLDDRHLHNAQDIVSQEHDRHRMSSDLQYAVRREAGVHIALAFITL